MPRPPLAYVLPAVLAFAPLRAQNAPVPGGPGPGRTAPKPITDVTLPELKELSQAPDGPTLRRLVEMARMRIGEVKDPEERALTQGTLDAIVAEPAMAKRLLDAHAMRLAEVRDKAPDIIFLRGLKDCKTNDDVVRYARELYGPAKNLGDPVLRLGVRLTLAKLEDKPADKDRIYGEHMKRVSERFYDAARTSFTANDARSAFSSIQVAVRCDPANIKARFLFAHLLQSALGETEKAIATLKIGLEFLTPAAAESREYLDRYFQLLESRERDNEVIADAATLLAKEGFDEGAREMLAMHLATCLYYANRYDEAERIIDRHHLDKRAQGLLLRAKARFDGRHPDAGTRLLEDAVSRFQGGERDAVLSQLQRFWTDLGKNDMALSVADQRIREFPERSGPYVHRLWLFRRTGAAKRFDASVREVFTRFGTDQSAMLGVANLAAENALPDLADNCFRRAVSLNFNRPMFALLKLEARINAKQYREALADYEAFIAMDKTMFKGDEGSVQALLAAAKSGVGDKVSKSESERHVKVLLTTPGLQPVMYISAAKLLRKAGDGTAARRILEAGRAAHPWNNRIRADLVSERILAGLTDDAHGSRPTVAAEVEAVAAGRRVSPKFWETVGFWLRTESASLPGDVRSRLDKLVSANERPDLVRDDTEN